MKTNINLIVGEKIKDDFMHKFDVFEDFKHIGEILGIEYELQKSEADLSFVTRLKEQFEKNGYFVTAIWIAKTPDIHYINWDVKVFSNGKNWAILEDYLQQFGITKPQTK